MARTLAQVAEQTQDDLQRGLIELYQAANEYLAWASTYVTDRSTIKINRVLDYGTVQTGMNCSTAYVSSNISAGPASFDLVKFGTQFDVCSDVVGLGSSFVDQAGEELKGALKRMTNKLAIDTITGNGSATIYGLDNLVTNSFAIAGSSVALRDIWRLKDEVTTNGGKRAFLANAATKRIVMEELLANAQVGTAELKGSSFRVPEFDGIQILTCNAMTDGHMYCVDGDNLYVAAGTIPGDALGIFKFYEVGYDQSYDAKLYRLNGHFAHVLNRTDAIARLTGIV